MLRHSLRSLLAAWLLLGVLISGQAVAAGNDYQVKPGFNVVGVTTSLRTQYPSAFALLDAWKSTLGVTAIEAYDQVDGVMARAELVAGAPSGVDFSLTENGALFVYAGTGGTVSLGDNPQCAAITLRTGFNLVSFFCTPPGFKASDLIKSLGIASILSISRFDSAAAKWAVVAVNNGAVVGEDFIILPGEGYIIYSAGDIANWTPPTVNLSPPTTLTGLGWTYFLTISLTEAAPSGGFPISLGTSTAGIVSISPVVTIPQGALSSQVTVTAIGIGATTITASAPGKALSGTTNIVTVKAIQTLNIGPALSPPVGIFVEASVPSTPQRTYGPVASTAVGVTVGSVVTGLAPNHGAVGTSDMVLRINGVGLSAATGVSFIPSDGISVLSALTVTADGSYAETHLSIAANAPIGRRTVLVATATGTIMPASPGANIFSVTYPQPELLGIAPIRKTTGSSFTLTLNGKYFFSASSIDFAPATGLSVNNPPTISSDGTTATVTVVIAADNALAGAKVVTLTTPGGTTSGTASAANTFTVTPDTDPGVNYAPLISPSVGVLVTSATATTAQVATYSSLRSLPVGVAVGPVITSVAPVSGAKGSTGLVVRVNGSGLFSAISMTFTPSTGIITSGTFTVAGDGSYAEAVIDIALDAPLTARTVALGGVAALPAAPGANQFKVTLPVPELLSISPTRKEIGSTFTLTVLGKDLTSASSIDFTPGAGLSVNNPPSISADGTTGTVTVVISAGTPTGERVVTVTTPGGTTSAVASAANTFTVTTDAGTTYTPVISRAVGVLVTSTTSTTTQSATYSPALSLPIGVLVESAPTPTTLHVNYSPIVSPAVGIAVGASITGITPRTIEPGATADIIINGVGLDQVNTVQIQPPSGFTVNSVTPAGDGLSVTVSITADSGVTVGTKTLIVSAPSGMIPAASAGTNLLLTGPKPGINSITNSGTMNVLQPAGTTFTLIVHGTHLQGATEVRIAPSDGVSVNNPPTYYTDGQGEHASVTVVISSTAIPGARAVIICTPYGCTDPTPTAANTIEISDYQGWNLPVLGDDKPVLARGTKAPAPAQENNSRLDPSCALFASAVSSSRTDKRLFAATETLSTEAHSPARPSNGPGDILGDERKRNYRLAGYRGPPHKVPLSPSERGWG